MAQICGLRHEDGLPRQVRVNALGVLQSVPVDFHVGAKAKTADDAFTAGNVVEADHDGLVLAGREAKLRSADRPAALAIGRFEDETAGLLILALLQSGVDGAVRGVNPAGRQ